MKGWLLLLLLLPNPGVLTPQANKRGVPAPLRAYVPFERAWIEMLKTLRETSEKKRNLGTVRENRSQGSITTDFSEYSSGPLTQSHLVKIGQEPKLVDGDWVRVEYQLEVLVEPIQAGETLITVNANIRALKRKFSGDESWLKISSNGRLEEDLLTEFGQALFGENFTLRNPKKGYWERWEREPAYLPRPDE